ncbi:MAG: DUF4845 domain-containing protein [Candidatus Contendobacter sp.]|nr:DUF4845 domain-containing protein [Candidatus Contendobacter sp.]
MKRTSMRIARQTNERQRGLTVLGMLILLIAIGFVALLVMKVVPMYVQYYTIKSSIESVRKESVGQMAATDIQNLIQKRFDTGYVENVRARDLKIRNDRQGKVLDLTYQDERELFQGLFVVLKVNEPVLLSP